MAGPGFSGEGKLTANGRNIDLTTRRTPIQARALTAVGTDTRTWDKATIT